MQPRHRLQGNDQPLYGSQGKLYEGHIIEESATKYKIFWYDENPETKKLWEPTWVWLL